MMQKIKMKNFAADNLQVYLAFECLCKNRNGAECKQNANKSLEMNLHFRMCDNGKKTRVELENVIQLVCFNRLRKAVNMLFFGMGELYLDSVMHDMRKMYSEIGL